MNTKAQIESAIKAIEQGELVWAYTAWGHMVQIHSIEEVLDAIYHERTVGIRTTKTVVLRSINTIIVDNYDILN